MRRRLAAALLLVGLLAGGASAGPAAAAPPQLEARAWALIEARSGEVLASHAARRRLPVASTTKLMTAYVALRELPLGQLVETADYPAIPGESLLEVPSGTRISVRDLLHGLILRSGNDSAADLALAAAGSVPAFVEEMNRYAAALGLADTRFANPIGLDAPGNFSSALDLTALARRLLRNPAFARIAASRTAVLRSLRPPARIETLNDFLLAVPWGTGVKTGHTFGAGYVLVGSGRRKGVELISAVLGAWTESTRDAETERLLEYGFSQYSRRTPVRRGEAVATASVRYGGELALRAVRRLAVGVRRGQRLRTVVRAPEEVEGPLRRGAVLGRATVTVDGRRVASAPLRAARGLPAPSTLDRAGGFLGDNALWLALAASAILGGAAIGRRLKR